jgi:electron transfer flavoprotein beta subunit
MDVLACVKRVPNTGAKIVLTDDQQAIDASGLGFTMSPHEECAVEEAVQIVEDHGGSSTVLTLGSDEATEQLRTALAMTVDEATLLETDGEEWGPRETANAVAEAVRADSDDGLPYDLMLFGTESADAANYQVGVRVAEELDVPFLAGVKELDFEDGRAIARREVTGGEEVYELDLPAAVSVKEGINEPRYASMRAKMRARNQEVDRQTPEAGAFEGTFEKVRLEVPESAEGRAQILGEGPEAVPEIVTLLRDELEVL